MDKYNKNDYLKVIKYFLMIFIPMVIIAGLSTRFLYQSEVGMFLDKIQSEEHNRIEIGSTMIESNFFNNRSDSLFLKDLVDLKQLSSVNDDVHNRVSSIEEEFRVFANRKGIYDQLRILDVYGMEKVRINYDADGSWIVDADHLQDKSDRYYYQYAMGLDENQVYVSDLDLNMENGQVEVPYKPTIRFSSPIYDENHEKIGVLITNFLAEVILEEVKLVTQSEHGHAEILNQQGYWLLSRDTMKEWAFMFGEHEHMSFEKEHPAVWNTISSSENGQMMTPLGLITYETVYPYNNQFVYINPNDGDDLPDEYYWKLISVVERDELTAIKAKIAKKYKMFFGSLCLALIFLVLPLAFFGARRHNYHHQLKHMAMHDNLTGLPNKRQLNLLMEKALENLVPDQQMAVLYLDFDGFKSVNDQFGHDWGDELLREGSRRLKTCLRESDILARMGGDEFLILLQNISCEGIEVIANRIISKFREPFIIMGEACDIGISIGIRLVDNLDSDIEALINDADQAMYNVKQKGKNNYHIHNEK